VTEQPPASPPDPSVTDLLGVLAYGALTAFVRVAEDAELAPTVRDKARLGRIAVTEFAHFETLVARLKQIGADPEEAMAPFVHAVDAFHARTAPADWLEGLVKAYVGEGIATDFYREIAQYVDAGTRDLVHEVLEDTGHADFVERAVTGAIERDPRVAGRLALWGRRLVGEALSQAQRVAADRDALADLLVRGQGGGGADLLEIGRMFSRLTEAHTARMARLGLAA
jgi:hypothetical protein